MELDDFNIVLQDNIQLGSHSILTASQGRQFKQWEKLRIKTRQLIIEDTRTKEKQKLKIGSKINLFAFDTTLVMSDHYSGISGRWSRKRTQWVVDNINSSDSSLNLRIPGLKARVKFSEIDSLNVKSQSGTFKIVGVVDLTQPNNYRRLP